MTSFGQYFFSRPGACHLGCGWVLAKHGKSVVEPRFKPLHASILLNSCMLQERQGGRPLNRGISRKRGGCNDQLGRTRCIGSNWMLLDCRTGRYDLRIGGSDALREPIAVGIEIVRVWEKMQQAPQSQDTGRPSWDDGGRVDTPLRIAYIGDKYGMPADILNGYDKSTRDTDSTCEIYATRANARV